MRPAERVVLVVILLAVAAALRIGFVATASVQAPLRADAGEYAQYAQNLVEHGVYSLSTQSPPPPDSFRSPGLPFLLAGCRWIGGPNDWYDLARTCMVVLSTATVLGAFLLARLFLGFWGAVVATALVALSPHLVVSSAYLLTECPTAAVVTFGLWLALGTGGGLRHASGALLLGAAPLCNEALVFLPLVAALTWWPGGRGRTVLLLLLAFAPLASWNVRNQTTELARRGGERALASISHGSYPGMVYRDPRLFGFPYREDPEQPGFGTSWRELRRVLVERVAAEPLRYARWYLLEKPVWLWSWPLVQGNDVYVYPVANSPYEQQPVMAASHVLMRWLHAPLMLLAAGFGLWSLVRGPRRAGRLPFALGLVALLATLAYVPVIPDPRYLQPIRPVLMVLSVAALWGMAARSRRRAAAAPEQPVPAVAQPSTAPGATSGPG